MDSAITDGLENSAELMKFRLLGELYAPKSGRLYQRASRSHIASAPGQSPASDYKALEGTLDSGMETPRVAVVGVGTPYAVPLEYGSIRVLPRPWFTPMAEEMRDEVPGIIATEIKKQVK